MPSSTDIGTASCRPPLRSAASRHPGCLHPYLGGRVQQAHHVHDRGGLGCRVQRRARQAVAQAAVARQQVVPGHGADPPVHAHLVHRRQRGVRRVGRVVPVGLRPACVRVRHRVAEVAVSLASRLGHEVDCVPKALSEHLVRGVEVQSGLEGVGLGEGGGGRQEAVRARWGGGRAAGGRRCGPGGEGREGAARGGGKASQERMTQAGIGHMNIKI